MLLTQIFFLLFILNNIQFVKSDANCDRPFSDYALGNCIIIELQDDEATPPAPANYLSCYWNGPYLCRAAENNGDPNDPEVLCCSNNVDGNEALREVTYLYHRYTQNLAFTTTVTPCFDVNPNCDAISYLCRESSQFGYMFYRCKMTCGFCGNAVAPPLCRDKPTVSCKQQSIYCNDPLYKDFLTQSCPRTCARCGPPYTWKNVTIEVPDVSPSPHLCIDVSTNCGRLQRSCSNVHVASSCRKTCGTCI